MRITRITITIAVLMALFLVTGSAYALSLTRGVPTPIGTLDCNSVTDSVILTGALVSPGVTDATLNISANRVQYDFLNTTQSNIDSWTLYYDASIGSSIIAAATPLGYIQADGTVVNIGGIAWATLFNAGYGIYNYNTGAPWIIDYQTDHITFSVPTGAAALPPGTAVGVTDMGSELPAFNVLFSPDLYFGSVDASAASGTTVLNGTVIGPVVPEPAGVLALFAGVAALAGKIWQRRR